LRNQGLGFEVLLAGELHVACWWAGWTEALLPAVVEVRGALTRVECRVQGWVEAGGTGCRQYVMDMGVPERTRASFFTLHILYMAVGACETVLA
jgi:hypothetical protein